MNLFTPKKLDTPPHLRMLFDTTAYALNKTLEFYAKSKSEYTAYKPDPDTAAYDAYSWAQLTKEGTYLKWLLETSIKGFEDDFTGFGTFEKLVLIWKRDERGSQIFEDFLTNHFLVDHQEIWLECLSDYPKKSALKPILAKIDELYYYGF